ncbi:MAG TPA: hypothetical protein VGI85_12315 [Chthoniobacterales bacterium]|jgi:hypothetical protein
MAPLIISGITSLASSILDKWTYPSEVAAAAQQQPRVPFDSLMKTRSLSGAVTVQPSQLSDVSSTLMQQLMRTPEIASALNGQNLPPGSQLEFSADGGVALRRADGFVQSLHLSPAARILAADVRATMAGAQG